MSSNFCIEKWRLRKDANELHINLLTKVLSFVERKIKIVFSKKENMFVPDDKLIIINTKQNIIRQTIFLLHEFGHYEILSSNSRKYKNRFVLYYDPKKITKEIKLKILDEEFEAWAIAEKFSSKLRIKKYLKEEFDLVKLSCLQSYCKWVIE